MTGLIAITLGGLFLLADTYLGQGGVGGTPRLSLLAKAFTRNPRTGS